MTGLQLTRYETCSNGWERVPGNGKGYVDDDENYDDDDDTMTGDLNENGGGEYIYLCMQKKFPKGENPLTAVTLKEKSGCPDKYTAIPTIGLNGNVNQNAGGSKDLYLCESTTILGPPIYDFKLTAKDCPSRYTKIDAGAGITGNFNEDSGGYQIFLCQSIVEPA